MPHPVTFHLIPHTHWDREWYRTRAAFRARLLTTFRAILDLLDGDPGARFTLDGQTVIVDDVLAAAPAWELSVARLVRQRRLAIGPWYVLADELLPAGESLLRNLLEGSRDAALLGGRMDVLYSPDAFGHPAVLPALAAEFGIASGVVWRGLMPSAGAERDCYRWQAPSGAEIVVHHLPRAGYESGAALLDPKSVARHWKQLRAELLARAATPEVAVWLGGDHRAPPGDLRWLRRRLQRLEPQHQVRCSTAAEYLAAVEPFRASLPVVSGELRWSGGHTWSLPGVHGTRLRLKRQHASAELVLLRHAEPLVALAGNRAGDLVPLLRTARRALLESEFHDTICGCVSDDVAREQRVRLDAVRTEASYAARVALDRLTGDDPDRRGGTTGSERSVLLLWNPAARPRSGIVTATVTFFRRDVLIGPPGGRQPRTAAAPAAFALTGPGGRTLPVQVIRTVAALEHRDARSHDPDLDAVDQVEIAFRAPPVPGLGIATHPLRAASSTSRTGGVRIERGALTNRLVAVTLSSRGVLRLDDLRTGRRYDRLFGLEDAVDRGDSYTVSIRRTTRRPQLRGGALWYPAAGPLVAAVAAEWTLLTANRGMVSCRMLVTLHADSPLVRVRFDLDHHARDHRLRATIPVGSGTVVRAGAAFGWEMRDGSPPDSTPTERAVATAPAQRYVAAGDEGGALAILAPGPFEYEWTPRREVAVTLLRATGELSRNDLAERPGHAGWPTPIPAAEEPGRHLVEWAVVPLGAGDLDQPARLEACWEDAFLPLKPVFVREFAGDVAPAVIRSGVELRGDGLVFSAAKPAESGRGLVVRCWNATDRTVAGEWRAARAVRRATRVRADESAVGAMAIRRRRSVPFSAPPRQIVSVLIEFED